MSLPALLKHSVRSVLVLGAIILITSVSIDATDSFHNSESALGILARYATTPECPVGTVPFISDGSEGNSLCIDAYEASVGERCVLSVPSSDSDTAANANDADCVPRTQSGLIPWTHVTETQAAQLCARAGKRLPTALEWYQAAAGTPDGAANCNLAGALAVTGSLSPCRSGVGAFDMIGNVWEFVSGSVVGYQFENEALPAEGYVSEVQTNGLPRITKKIPDVIYNNDYFWSEATGTFALMRGGFYGSGNDGGLYSTHAAILQRFSSAAVGFRCVTVLSA